MEVTVEEVLEVLEKVWKDVAGAYWDEIADGGQHDLETERIIKCLEVAYSILKVAREETK